MNHYRSFRFLGLVLSVLGVAGAVRAADKIEPQISATVPSTTEAAAADEAPETEESQPRSKGDDTFGGEESTPVGGYTIRTLVQTRMTQTSISDNGSVTAKKADLAKAARETLTAASDPAMPPTNAQLRRRADETNGAYNDALEAQAQDNDGLRLNRVFLRAITKPYAWLEARMLVDFAELTRNNPKKVLKLAYARLTPHDRVTITAGLFKLPFSLLELLPIADFELADSGLTDNLIKDLGFGGRDIGVMLQWDPLPKKKWLSLYLAAFQGENTGRQDTPGPGIVAGRVESEPLKHLVIGADMAWRPTSTKDSYIAKSATSPISLTFHEKYASGQAVSFDATWNSMKKKSGKGFIIRGEFMLGDRTDVDYLGGSTVLGAAMKPAERRRGDARTYMAAWVLAAYRYVFTPTFAIMPAARFEYLDEDRENAGGSRNYISAGLNFEFTRGVRFLIDTSFTTVENGTFVRGQQPEILDTNTRTIIGQLQITL